MIKTVHINIKGKVQGVFYRASAKKEAENLGLQGWVKNCPDGSVEAMVAGDDLLIEQFIEWCKLGPAKAAVDNVIVTEQPLQIFESFRIIK